MIIEAVFLVALALFLFYRWAIANYDFFEKRGIPHDKPFPLFGSMKDVVFRKTSMFDKIKDLYDMHGGKFFGVYDQRYPMLMIKDPAIIKQITVKDFDHFVNHRSPFGEGDDSNLFSNSLFILKDAKWKDMRSTLSPAFTGSKMRHMFELINKVASDSVVYLQDEIKDDKAIEIDMKDFSSRFSNDVIASTAFGLEVNSYKNKSNQFYQMGKDTTTFTAWRNLKFFLYINFRPLMKLLKLEIFEKKTTDYFMHLVLDAMKYRKEHNISRPDMINMLMEARGMIDSEQAKSHNREWSDVEIVAQCFLFFFAGFETASVLTCFVAHELMENPEVQQNLFEEIDAVCADLDGKELTYEKLQGMKYLDMVVSEALRKWPGAIAIDRIASKDFVYDGEDGEHIEVKQGEGIWIPVCGLQRDPKYFPNPNKFDPERFNDENKEHIVPFTYLPFGAGPRNCIGSRFALLESKAMVYYLVKHFRILAAEKTMKPLVLTAGFQMVPKNGFWLKLVSRSPNA